MIYRTIFGEMPTYTESETVSLTFLDLILPGYAQTGMTYITKGAKLNVFR